MAIVTRGVEQLENKSCGICDNDFSALPENILSLSLMDKKISNSSTSLVTTATGRTIGLVAIVTREIERFEKNLVAFVTTTF